MYDTQREPSVFGVERPSGLLGATAGAMEKSPVKGLHGGFTLPLTGIDGLIHGIVNSPTPACRGGGMIDYARKKEY